jgi:hypothetical protein
MIGHRPNALALSRAAPLEQNGVPLHLDDKIALMPLDA